jgi:hypothetical protein
MLFPVDDNGIPMITVASGRYPNHMVAVPILYIILLSAFKELAVFTAEPKAIPKSNALKMHVGPRKSLPCILSAFSNP